MLLVVWFCLLNLHLRPLLLSSLAALAVLVAASPVAADSTVVFNEIQYHPATAEPDFEWVELHNQMAVNMDLSKWSIVGGIDYTFAEGTVLAGGGYLVVALNPSALINATGATNVLGPFSGRLSNSGEKLQLRNNNGRVMDAVEYGTDGDWPLAPDGTGVTLAKREPNLASAPAESWRPSAQIGGTPGAANFTAPGATPSLALIPIGAQWQFANSGAEAGPGWREAGFDATQWFAAPTPLYGGNAPAPGGELKTIPRLFNTGVGDAGELLAPGSLDPHYVVTASAEPVSPPPPAPALVIEGHPAWLANDANSSWLGPINPGAANVAAGAYRVRTTVDLTGFDPATASLNIWVAADNRLNDILLNGASKGLNFVGFTSFSPEFKVTSGFVAGPNSLEFRWANDAAGANPAGFRALVRGTARTLAAPESRLEPVHSVAYFRHSFVFDGNPSSMSLTLRAAIDDGAVFYLNGVELYRFNLPAGPLTPETPAVTNVLVATGAVLERTFAPGFLRNGTNVLAVELHQAADGLQDAWLGAELVGEAVPVGAGPDVVFNETAPGGKGFFVELANRLQAPVRLGGYSLERVGSSKSRYVFPDETSIPASGFLAVTSAVLSFEPAVGEPIALYPPGRLSVADAVEVRKTPRARHPDATGRWLVPAQATPGAANSFQFQREVVINEVMYHPLDTATSGSWLELHNRGMSPVDLTGWRFESGISFHFAPGTQIPAGEYLVLAEDPQAMQLLHPDIAVVGPYTNKLSHSSDRLTLTDPLGNPADEVRYFDGGRWPTAADGGGSSLELRDPWADHSAPEAWAASREAGASTWSNYTYRATAAAVPGPTRWNEFVLGLLDAGECLLDDIKVVETPAGTPVALLQNGNFENGSTGWRFLGTHRGSRVIVDPDNPGNHVLDLIATGATEHMHNHVETTLVNNRAVVNGRQYEVSFRARWLSGENQLNTRLYFNRVARTTRLGVPSPNGTPGKVNSTFEPNIGPTFSHLRNTPVVPAATEPVTISVEAADPQGVASGRLYWSVNGGAWNSQPLESQSDGVWTAAIPASPAGSVVQHYVQATDGMGAMAMFPAAGPGSRALYIVNDQRAPAGRLHNLRILMTPADRNFLHALTNVMSNEPLGATVIYDEQQVFHDVGVHLQGSERGRGDGGRVGFTINFPPDNLFRGVHDGVSIDRSGGYTGVGGDQDEILLKHALQHAGGLPGMYDDLVRVIPPRTDLTGPGLLLMAKYGDVFLDSQFDHGSDGSEFKLELIYYPTTTATGTPQGPKLPQPDEVLGVDIGDLGNDPETYRWFFLQENNRRRNDYSQVMALAKAFSKSGTALDTESRRLMDVSAWMRAVAFQSLWGLVDTYPFDNPHNFMIYFRPEDGRALPFLWDMDYNFGAAASSPLNRAGGNLAKLIAMPRNQRLYLGHMLDLVTTTYNTNYLTPWIQHFGGLVGQNFSGIRTYVDQRVKSVRSQLPAPVAFGITSNGGQDQLVTTPTVTVAGRAWINVRDIVLEGSPEPLEFKWTSTTAWQTSVPLMIGTNRLQFLAFDFQGTLVASNAMVVTSSALGGALDTDGDGIPDAWEVAHGLNPNRADGSADPDHDGLGNAEEYLAGTDPGDASSFLWLAARPASDGPLLTFRARAGRSYTIVSRDSLNTGDWRRVAEFAPEAVDHDVEMIDPSPAPAGVRWYRLVTPRLP